MNHAGATILQFSYQKHSVDVCRPSTTSMATGLALRVRNRAGERAIAVERFGKQFFFYVSKENPEAHLEFADLLNVPVPTEDDVIIRQRLTDSLISEEQIENIITVAKGEMLRAQSSAVVENLFVNGFPSLPEGEETLDQPAEP